jgi:hypothetical protein
MIKKLVTKPYKNICQEDVKMSNSFRGKKLRNNCTL